MKLFSSLLHPFAPNQLIDTLGSNQVFQAVCPDPLCVPDFELVPCSPGGEGLSLAQEHKHYRARTCLQLLTRFCTWHPLVTKGKRWCELQLSITVLPCWDEMDEPLRAGWRKGRQWWAPALCPFTAITPLGAPQHPHHGLLWSPARCTMQKKVVFFVSIRLSLPTHVPFVTP